MKITRWAIDGFGIFNGFDVPALGDGLNVFVGPNEAGKSTLLAFLRFVLFGFDGRSREPRYQPLRGGRHGGRVFITTAAAAGEYIIERHAGRRPPVRVIRPDGREGDEADLGDLLGGADYRLFRSVFAFSLTELQSFESLSSEGVRDRIFSAGIAGAGRSARDALAELDRRAGALLKTRGQAPINDLLSELATLAARVDGARQSAHRYEEALTTEEKASGEITRLGAVADELRRLKATWLLLGEVWPLWNDLQTTHAELDALDPIDEFPADAETRLAALTQQQKASGRALADLVEARRAAEARRAEMRPDELLAALEHDVEGLYETLALHRTLLQQLPTYRLKLHQAKAVVGEKLRVLCLDVTEDTVETFDLSLVQQEQVREWAARLERGTAEVSRLKSELEAAVRKRQQLQEAHDQLAGADAEGPDTGGVDEQDRAIRRLRANLAELRVAEAETSAHDKVVQDRERNIRALEHELKPDSSPWVVATVWLLAIGGVFAVQQIERLELVGLAILVALLVAGGFTYLFIQRRRWTRDLRAHQKTELDTLRTERDDAVSSRNVHARAAAELAGRVATDAESLGLGSRPSLEDLDDRERRLNQLKDHWAQRITAAREIDAASAEVGRLLATLGPAERALSDDEMRWAEHKRAARLPDALSPQGVLDYFETVRTCQDGIRARRAAKEEAIQVAQRVGLWDQRGRAVLAAAGIPADVSEERVVEELLTLRRRAVQNRETRGALESIQVEIQGLDRRIESAQEALREGRQARDRLLAEAGASDDAGFRVRIEIYRRRSALRARAQDLERQVAARIGYGPEADGLRETLFAGQVDEWRRLASAADVQIEQLQQARDQAVASHRDAQRARLELEASADLARFELERGALEAELAALVHEWRGLITARVLIDETLRRFERTRQPAVLAEASGTFQLITNGRYRSVVQEENARELAIIDGAGGRRPTEALSRGTAEQLYLCIRLALSAEFGRRTVALPLVLDDVLVNFDPDRARAVAEMIADYARRHQILVFTCHPTTRQVLMDASSGAKLFELVPVSPAVLQSDSRGDGAELTPFG